MTLKIYKNAKAEKNILTTYDMLLKMWNVDIFETDIPTTYGSTHVITCGDKSNPPLILFHGVGDNSALMWVYNARELSRCFWVIAIDTIGGPGKSRPNDNYSKEFDDIRWIDEILTGFALDKVFMAGVSNGAYLAQLYGIFRPERVIKMICLSGTVPVGTGNPIKTMIKIFMPEALFPTKKNTEKLLRKLSGNNSDVFTENLVIMEHYRWLLKGFNNMAMRFHKIIPFDDEQINSIREKTLYIAGDEDPFMILGGKELLLRYKMNAKFFPSAGHGINHEISDIVNQQMIEFLR